MLFVSLAAKMLPLDLDALQPEQPVAGNEHRRTQGPVLAAGRIGDRDRRVAVVCDEEERRLIEQPREWLSLPPTVAPFPSA